MKFGAFPNRRKKIDSAVLSSFNVMLFVFKTMLSVFLNREGFRRQKSLSQNPTHLLIGSLSESTISHSFSQHHPTDIPLAVC